LGVTGAVDCAGKVLTSAVRIFTRLAEQQLLAVAVPLLLNHSKTNGFVKWEEIAFAKNLRNAIL
jgi:hypothetical protein